MLDRLSSVAEHHPRFWSYLVLASTTISLAASSGLLYGISGALTLAQSEIFKISIAQSSWTLSVCTLCISCLSPLSAIAMKSIPIRLVQLAGGLLSILGFCLASLATHYWFIVICVGLVTGSGMSMIRAAGAEIIRHHFKENRIYLALSISSLGFTSGLFLVPFLAHLLFTQCSFSVAMLILASTQCVHLVGGLVYLVPKTEQAKTEEKPSIRQSFTRVLSNARAVAYIASGLLRTAGVTTSFAVFTAFFIKESVFTREQAAMANSVLGACTTVGAISSSFTQKFHYDRLVVHSGMSATYGILLVVVTEMKSEKFAIIFLGLAGLVYGLQFGNLMGVARYIAGSEDMVLALSLVLLMQGLGGLLGPQVNGALEQAFGTRIGIKFAGTACIVSGLFIAPVILREKILGLKSFNKENLAPKEQLARSYKLSSEQMEREPLLEKQALKE